ncbi:YtxH domain-containing protein [Arthrobacter psychrochitiniphilus]|uniref:YtxH domain-containing protein n=1 Tax=Arthrobacter psychrochitiniphilus TaxID=291045 RepID=A0A2V3DP31_9MICC|nr:YtxH domain-containing protein [Arthrobacter psychrochitiniphilus]NYG16193.1 hypothetical protein [Arthrobacter psychrochitiniphilus]PXA64431.1 hypothetical protein CVS29_14875 [Arthrobacter psychrochitiniphilus]
MKAKLTFIAGLGAEYILGSRAGRAHYDQLKSSVRKLWNRDEVQGTVASVQESVKAQAGEAVNKLVHQVLPARESVAENSDAFRYAGLHSGRGRG